ncbi:LOW QUALITY PROTEIN: C3a anaphylatoxin chemotactic receptor-like [Alosa alosa]|uniref:LOW QUALITY PROTEIN: C3a anaphylatoxin chemotactic receptor-like n=1 Tax=Alosa alosa TaxID=278164 RepID=UPI0020151401|nr:LOW QUALITY PROTEIN: C3a anaphylatoxin chemotactic receptor-like [Alosa alosa]
MEIDFDLLNLTYSDYGNFTYNEDTSNTPELTVAHNTVKIISLVIYSLTFLIGVPGNACVIWIAGLKMKRTVNGVWFINLAIADFLCCLSIPFSITNTLLDTNWPYGNVICQIIPLFVVLNMFARVFTLALISLDRLALVVRPVWAQNHRSLVLAWVLCGLAWVLALLLSLHAMILTYVTQDGGSLSQSLLAHTQMIHFLFGFLVPLLLIITSYIIITLKVLSSSYCAKRASKIIVAVVVAFFICWLPYHAFGLVREYGQDEGLALHTDQLSIALAFVNSCLNPLLYVFMGQNFKEKVSLKLILEDAINEDNTTHSYVCS